MLPSFQPAGKVYQVSCYEAEKYCSSAEQMPRQKKSEQILIKETGNDKNKSEIKQNQVQEKRTKYTVQERKQ